MPNFTGPAIFAGIGQGVEKGAENYLKLRHMQMMEKLAMYRGLHGAVNDWWKSGGYEHPLPDDTETTSLGASAAQLGGPPPAAE